MLLAACGGSDRLSPTEAPVLRDRIVFESGAGIGVMAPDGSDRARLPIGSDLELALQPVVSPDGRRIAFVGSRDGLLDLYLMNADGSGRAQLTADSAIDLHPAWSPAGGRLLFDRTEPAPGSRPVLLLVNADGSGRKQLRVDAAAADWSPDGARVAFSGTGTLEGIYVMDQDGGNVTAVGSGCGVGCADAGPRWSPDGRLLAFTRTFRDGTRSVGVMGADGSDPHLLLPALRTAGPVWSPDGRRVALTRLDGAPAVYLLTPESGDTVRLGAGVVSDWAP